MSTDGVFSPHTPEAPSTISAVGDSWLFGELLDAVRNAPTYHVIVEVLLIALVLRLWFFNSYKIEAEELTEEEQDQLINEWQPEPLVPLNSESQLDTQLNHNLISGPIGKFIHINDNKCLDLASFNFLGLIGNKRIEKEALKGLHKYGVGSCGPRGFYGTIDVHLELEKRLAHFMGVEEAILYSYGFSTGASAVPAYAKKGDLVYADEAVNFALQQGLKASRSKIRYFKHNDMEDLERLMKEQENEDKRNPNKAKATRRFIVVEGLYLNRGQLCPLPKLIDLKYAYKTRLFLDESYSFGVIGKTGRGVSEHFGCDINDIDLIVSSLECSVGSIGGFCCGSSFVVDHQRLSASGYVFSASLPPLLASASIEALNLFQSEVERIHQLQKNCIALHEALSSLRSLNTISCADSPIQHVVLEDPSKSHEQCALILQQVCEQCISHGFAINTARYVPQFETFRQRPSVRLVVKHDTTQEEIAQFVTLFHSLILHAL